MLFQTADEAILQQLNIQDSNAQLWLAEFAWHDTSSAHYRSAYHILDMVFWFGNLQILSAHQYPTTAHLKFLSRQMQNDLANFAKSGKMPWRCIIMNVAIIAHINNVIASKKHT